MSSKKKTTTKETKSTAPNLKDIYLVRGVVIEGMYYAPNESIQVTPDVYKSLKRRGHRDKK